jgi:regulator of sirC expression with transglutaminase-like and TPR domain
VDRVGHGAAAGGEAHLTGPGQPEPYTALARQPDPPLDELALGIAAAFRAVDAPAALATPDGLGAEVAAVLAERRAEAGAADAPVGPELETHACVEVLGGRHGFRGDAERYDDPANSMLDVVLERRLGLPILLSVVYVEVARRASVALSGIGLRGHFVAGHLGGARPVLIDPFAGGAPIEAEQPADLVRAWTAHEIALRMLNNLVASYRRRGDIGAAITAATMRLELPLDERLEDTLRQELRAMRARLN